MGGRTAYLLILLVFLAPIRLFAQDTVDLYPEETGCLKCWSEKGNGTRPLRIFCLELNLLCGSLEIITLPADDPDGDGPAEASLTLPEDLFNRFGCIAAVNANAFSGLPGTEQDIPGWYLHRPVNISGMVVSRKRIISPAQPDRTAFRTDQYGKPHIGNPTATDTVVEAVSDWGSILLNDSRIVPDSSVTVRHPRTAVGFDLLRTKVLFAVVDGRQPGYSDGISLHELAVWFRSKGCDWAANLDGGGSSIMLVRQENGKSRTLNRPSGVLHRPVPVMIGIRKKGGG